MICFDANVLIEIIIGRKNAGACRDYIGLVAEDMAVTMLSVDLIMYYAEASKLKTEPVELFLRQFIWLPLTDSDAEWAFKRFANKDFADALQIACTKREKCNKFTTLDKSLAKKYADVVAIDLLG
jgi:predicted nucleic acid-binding protein